MTSSPNMILAQDDPRARAAVAAIHDGQVEALEVLLDRHPELARARVALPRTGCGLRTLLHIATDWPGHRPRVGETVALLVRRGAPIDAGMTEGPHGETPLHWAASCDDLEALDALLDAGADIEAPGAVIGGGTPLADAVAFGQWRAAVRLVERGARASLWQAAALGLIDDVVADLAGAGPAPSARDVTNAFWCACHGGQKRAAELLLSRGAELNWIGHDGLTPLDAAVRHGAAPELVAWLRERGGRAASELPAA